MAVYDGHGGFEVAELAKSDLLAHLCEHISQSNVANALTEAFSHVEKTYYDAALKAYQLGFGKVARIGSCALVAVINKDRELVAANTGDCRGIIVNEDFSTVQFNNEHNAARPIEQERLKKEFIGETDIVVCKTPQACYVKGRLQPTRSLGDFHLKHEEFNNPQEISRSQGFPPRIKNFKGGYVSGQPEITSFKLKPNDRFLVMASDGLWDELNNKEVAELVIQNKTRPKELPNKLIEKALEKVSQRSKLSIKEIKQL